MLIEWNACLETGVFEIDYDHKRLIALANAISLAATRREVDVAVLAREFCNYCDDHFVMEEVFMKEISYPWYQEHKADHDFLLVDLDRIMAKVKLNPEVLTVVPDFINSWTANHVLVVERKLAEFVRARACSDGLGI
ncbi:MAG: hemerythrin domain-containing protein [Rhodospirillaceae bacterium]